MLAYGILDGDAEITDMIISALAQLCAGNVGINSANVGNFVVCAIDGDNAPLRQCVKQFICTRNAILNHAIASDQKYSLPERELSKLTLASDA